MIIIENIKAVFRPFYTKLKLYKSNYVRRRNLQELQSVKQIRCVFLALFDSVWKYDKVYEKMLLDNRFDPIILICPVVNFGDENMVERMSQCEMFFEKKGYKYICAYDKKTKHYIDLRKELKPDIIFYTNPYKGLIDDRYYIDNFCDELTVFVPYGMGESAEYRMLYNQRFHNLLWRRYAETNIHKEISEEYSDRKGENVVVTGYPGIEDLIIDQKATANIWPSNDTSKRKIIWAPHHTLNAIGKINYSCFLQYDNFMLEMARKYRDHIQIAFKPHPLLRNKLIDLWGKEKTDEYYSKWKGSENTCVQEGEYVDLFKTSDAMIHDSSSFIGEYLYVNKPVLRTVKDKLDMTAHNKFGVECIKRHYLAYSEQDIEDFIKNVINGIDPLKESRTQFLNDVLIPKNGLPSDNIIDDIIDSINNLRV